MEQSGEAHNSPGGERGTVCQLPKGIASKGKLKSESHLAVRNGDGRVPAKGEVEVEAAS